MFAHCCGNATIVAQRPPLFGLIRCRCAANFGQPRLRKVRCRPSVTIWAIDNEVSPTRESPRTDIALPDRIQQRPACCRESHNTIRTTVAAPDRSIAAIAHSDVTTSDIHRVRNGSRHFCATGTFCASFRHAMRQPTTCVAESGFIFRAR